MNSLLNATGYTGLLLITVFSGTILPGPSDPTIIGMFVLDFVPFWVIVIASIGIMIGRIINYYVGTLGEEYVMQKKKWLKEKQVAQSKQLFNKYGTLILLFTWVPFIDDPLTVVAGFMRYPFSAYMLYTTIAVIIRHVGLYAIYLLLA